MDLDEAIRFLVDDICIDDFIYNVRERAREEYKGEFKDSWELPLVKNYALACSVLKGYLDGRQTHNDDGTTRVG